MQQPETENPSKKNKAKGRTSQQVDAVEARHPEKVTNHTESVTGEESIKHKKKRKKRNREKEVAAAGESGTGEMSEAGKEGDSNDPTTSKRKQKKKRGKGNDLVSGVEGNATAEMGGDGKEGGTDVSPTSKPKHKKPSSGRVSFSGEVEVFDDKCKSFTTDALVRGKRFTPEEDDLVKEAVMKYIEGNQLGKEGLQMVLNNQKHPHLRGCWKAIGASLPWRPVNAVYVRAHTLFERCEARKWEPHEYETLMRYKQLSSPLVSQGLWFDTDDYQLLDVLQKLDACCVEDVNWDNLIENRSGDICRKRWDQMVRHIGGHREKSFIEQLDVLSMRYCSEMLQYRKDEGCSNATTLSR